MNMFADVALPVAIDREFTYQVPSELEHLAVIGARVIVPFGRQLVTGLIVGLPRDSNVTSLKPIRDVLDPEPVASKELLDLCRWIASYYFAPLGEVLKAAFPHGLSATSKRIARPVPGIHPDAIAEIARRAPRRAEVLGLLLKEGELPAATIQKRTGIRTINATLNELVLAGLIETEEVLPRSKVKPRTMEFVMLDRVERANLFAAIELLSTRKKKSRQVLETIATMIDRGIKEISVQDLMKRTGASSTILKEFRISELLPIERREISRQQEYGTEEQTLGLVLNAAQQSVLAKITGAMATNTSRTFLLHGVTGSGKTQVYIEAIRDCLQRGRSAIVLVPEISLTPQIVRRFKSHFGEKVAVVHSRMSAGERHDVWRMAHRGACRVVIGPRSAVFAPLRDLGLIVVDEEHEASYKQFDSSPRYHARDVAIVRGTMNKAVVVLGSATPSAESYHNALAEKYELLEMPNRVEAVTMPSITIVDLAAERRRAYAAAKVALPNAERIKLKDFQHSSISLLLKDKIEDRLRKREGIILLQNRRGFAPFVECPDCGYVEMCENCNVTLTYHLTKKHLRCHYCGLIRPPHTVCPQCQGMNIQLHGVGTQKVEQELAALFPGAKVLRMDLDTTSRKGAHDRLLTKFGNGEADILLGTQMVAKGLDFARVTLVGVISADTQMLLPDFRASERTFQLLTQVAGRAGRSTLKGEVIIQTYQPHHAMLEHVIAHDFRSFYEEELQARQELEYPPFSRLALIETKGPNEADVQSVAEKFARLLAGHHEAYAVLGPAPAVIGKIKNQYRWHIIIKNRKSHDSSGRLLRQALRAALQEVMLKKPRDVRLIVDMDPAGLM